MDDLLDWLRANINGPTDECAFDQLCHRMDSLLGRYSTLYEMAGTVNMDRARKIMPDVWRTLLADSPDEDAVQAVLWNLRRAQDSESFDSLCPVPNRVAQGTAQEPGKELAGRGQGDKRADEGEQAHRYVFKNEGATWRIIYEGSETTVKGSKGMRYIQYLIEYPNTATECRDIECACSTESPESGKRLDSGEAIEADLHTNGYHLKQLDSWDAKDIESSLNKLKADIEDTDDPARKATLKEKAGHLAEYLRKNLNKHGQPRSVDERELARGRVQKAVNKAKKAIKSADKNIGSHFEAVRGEGTAYIYKPSSEIPWTFE